MFYLLETKNTHITCKWLITKLSKSVIVQINMNAGNAKFGRCMSNHAPFYSC